MKTLFHAVLHGTLKSFQDVEEFLGKVNDILGTEQFDESKPASKDIKTPAKSPKSRTLSSASSSPKTATAGSKAATKSCAIVHNPRLPDPQMSDKHSFSKDELEKLSRLR